MKERDVLHAVRLEFGQQPDFVIWRNSTGAGLQVQLSELNALLSMLIRGQLQAAIALLREIVSGRVYPHGLCKGSSDIIGLAPGGLFLAVETKGDGGRATPEQLRFLALIHSCGGAACLTRSLGEAKSQIAAIRNGERRHGW